MEPQEALETPETPEAPAEPTRTRARPQLQTRDQAAAGAVQATSLTDAFGAGPFTLTLRGRELTFSPLQFNDLLAIEERWGSVEGFLGKVNQQDLRAIRYLFWVSLSKEHPDMAEEDPGRYLPVGAPAIFALVGRVAEISGLTDAGGSRGNEAAPG